jgi:hypothetical protein
MQAESKRITVSALIFLISAAVLLLTESTGHSWVHVLILSAVFLWLPMVTAWCVKYGILPKTIEILQMPAGLLLAIAVFIDDAMIAGPLSLPWVLLAGMSVLHLLIYSHWWHHWYKLLFVFAFIFWLVAGGWFFCYQIGYRPFNFSPVIVLLTAAHFHFAGFLLTMLSAYLALQSTQPAVWIATVLVLLGMPLTAAGILCTQLYNHSLLESLGGCIMAAGAVGVGGIFAFTRQKAARSGIRKGLYKTGGICLFTGMCLAAAYALRPYVGANGLDIPTMYHIHGTLNMTGLGCLTVAVFQLD